MGLISGQFVRILYGADCDLRASYILQVLDDGAAAVYMGDGRFDVLRPRDLKIVVDANPCDEAELKRWQRECGIPATGYSGVVYEKPHKVNHEVNHEDWLSDD